MAIYSEDAFIGGVPASSPNISLNADGTASFAGNVTPPATGRFGYFDRQSIPGGLFQISASTNGDTLNFNNSYAAFGTVNSTSLTFGNPEGSAFSLLYSGLQGGKLSCFVDGTALNLAYSAGNNIVLSYNASSQIIGTVDGVAAILLGTGSDRRLKENVQPSTYGIDAVKALRPVVYDIIDGDSGKLGFIAHEAGEAVPGSAFGEKDGEMMQSIDTYPIVAALTKALQESITRIETLESEVAALKGA